jgi:hypothetical protein
LPTSIFGTATINGSGSVDYRIDVQLAAWRRGADTYRIRLGNGYESGAQRIRGADVEIHIRSSTHQHDDPDASQGSEQDGS